MEIINAPSLANCDFLNFRDQIFQLVDGGCQWFHIDIMDGTFVPSISFGMPVISSIRKVSDLFFDVHLMMEKPERYIQAFADCGADGITVHAEASTHLHRTIQSIHAAGVRAGVA